MNHSSNPIFTISILAASIAIIGPRELNAHPDDPKILDALPPVAAEPYRRDAPGAALRGVPQFDALDVELLSWLPVNSFGLNSNGASDIWGYTSPSGREYALITLSNGLSFVDITNPGNAQIVETFSGPNSLWHDVKVYSHYAYAVSEGGQGIRIYDMQNIDNGQVVSLGSILTGGAEATHNVAIDEDSGYLYRTGGHNNGLRIYSLASPTSPQFVGSWSDRYVHDAQVVRYDSVMIGGQLVSNREIAFCCSGFNGGSVDTGLTILDVTDKSNPIVIAQTAYPERAYSHQAWLSEDRKYLFHNDELDEQTFGKTTTTRVFDVSDLASPVQVATFTNGNTAISHNLFIKGNLMYAANYRSGLRIFDVSDPMQASEIAYFDTYPGSDSPNFNGAWSVYPFFESGTIIVSDIERGLFVLRHNSDQIVLTLDSEPVSLIAPIGSSLDLTIEEYAQGTLDPASPRMVLNRGQGLETIPLLYLGENTYRAHFPALPCFDEIEFYFAADSTNGSVTTLPPAASTNGGYMATVATNTAIVFEDDFEIDTGWIVGASDDDATSGIWERAAPNGTIAQPSSAYTGVFCFITGQHPIGGSAGANDVDNGKTTLLSPPFDLATTSGGSYEISYWRWYSNNAGANPNSDIFTVDISSDNGQTWIPVEVVGPGGEQAGGGWFQHRFNPDDFIDRRDTVRLRFVASDYDPQALVEAAVDAVKITRFVCESQGQLPGDANGDGVVDLNDLNIVLSNFGQVTDTGDLNGDGIVDLNDLNIILSNFGTQL